MLKWGESGDVQFVQVAFSKTPLNKFRYPYIQLVVSLILPMDVNIWKEKMRYYTDFSLMQNLCPYLDISTVEYPTETPFYNWYYISELSNLTSLPSQCYRHSDGHTVCAVRQCTTVDTLWASVQAEKDKNSTSLSFLTLAHAHLTHSVNTEHPEGQYSVNSLTVISLTECHCGTIQTLCVGEMSKRKCTYKHVLIVIFWKFLESAEFNGILLFVVYSWHMYGLPVFNDHLLRF